MMLLFGFHIETAHGETPQMEKRPVTHQVKLTAEQQNKLKSLSSKFFLSEKKSLRNMYSTAC